ncbi:MAG: transcription-repair coupling factor [Fimbriimonadia bacterium]
MHISDWALQLRRLGGLSSFWDDAEGRAEWRDLAVEARAPFVAAMARPRLEQDAFRALIVTSTYESALQWQARLALYGVPERCLLQLPNGSSTLFEDTSPELNALSERVGSLLRLASGGGVIVIASPTAALEYTLPPARMIKETMLLKVGQECDLELLLRRLVRKGYEAQEPVRMPSGFSRRGGIVDIYPMGRGLPVRLEFFGDEIESMREFDPQSQRSVREVEEVAIPPARETLVGDRGAEVARHLAARLEREASTLTGEARETLEEAIQADIAALQSGLCFDRETLYRPLVNDATTCALDYLGDDGLLIVDEPLEISVHVERAHQEMQQALETRMGRGEMLSAEADWFLAPPARLGEVKRLISMSLGDSTADWLHDTVVRSAGVASMAPYRTNPQSLVDTIRNWLGSGFTVVVGTDQPTRARQTLTGIDVPWLEGEIRLGGFHLASGNPAGGFAIPSERFAVLTDAELFGVGRLRLPQKRYREGAPIATVLDLKPGDYVVHIYFGIGIYRGLVTRRFEGVEKEFLHIEYAPPDKLFVPVDQLDRIQKYLAPTDEPPKVNRLHSGEWQRTVKSAKQGAREMAEDLLKIYAARAKVTKDPFPPDSPWQAEMEATFPWVETRTQLRAINEVKRDLEQPHPMDRLVCGDVGFGKTEVAVRAAFKVAQEGRQVGVLCPTTILATQHYETFRERLAPYPVCLDFISRFKSPKQQKEILAKLKTGELDVVIGTHRLLSKDVVFHNLGLLIVDEEQRFGVMQKEQIKKLRAQVDVLTLTATPIPRTLSMAMMDIRSMSVITDPPPGRLPIRTCLRAYHDSVVREAILRELARNGQVYYVYNRVQHIHHIADHIARMVPSARIAVGHGQMDERELEAVMLAFYRGEFDVLVCTTIIENGLDVPRCNTIIVDGADRLGLAQLYQLRGRVGRSDRQAYAYLLYRKEKVLTETALQRLKALEEFSDLGSGYSLAFRDLQIRGAGELLGSKQHGFVVSVGYDLFVEMIREAVNDLRGVPLEEAFATLPTFDLPITAQIPASYVTDQAQRLFFYRRLTSSRTEEDLAEVLSELKDRYGPLPADVEAAAEVMRLRMRAYRVGVAKLEMREGVADLVLGPGAKLSPKVCTLLTQAVGTATFKPEGVRWHPRSDILGSIRKILGAIEKAPEVARRAASPA